jgi:hypothetical protein
LSTVIWSYESDQDRDKVKAACTVVWDGQGLLKLFVKSCKFAIKIKSTKHHMARLGQYPAGVPIERIHMDILGPLPDRKISIFSW